MTCVRPLVSVSPLLTLELPWPPSANHYYRSTSRGVLISRAGRQYVQTVARSMRRGKTLTQAIIMVIDAHPPDGRRRDLDNLMKPLIDTLQKIGVYRDDNQLSEITITRRERRTPGVCRVSLYDAGQPGHTTTQESTYEDDRG